ncbi:MAG: XRE family transcriptional regulator [Gemmatimonadetes bacterium]|nr:MAG: XRE family transcriptional regulator [Gemmatimonadota bacterium]
MLTRSERVRRRRSRVDVPFVIRHRLEELGLEQRDLARAARVTESYISQLLTRRKAPPAPNRTDIYERMDKFLRLPSGELAKLAELQRKEQLKRELGEEPTALLGEVRELILRKCAPAAEAEIRAIFERQPLGELERLVTSKVLEVAKQVARQELDNEYWVRMMAQLGGRSYEEMRVIVLEFLDTDIFHVSAENCVSFLDPLIVRRFEFVEQEFDERITEERGLTEFLRDPALSGTATAEEIAFLKRLRFTGKRPTPLFYYRELQSLRDPLHFPTPPGPDRH